MTFVLGVDVGTSSTRAIIIDELGKIVAAATAEHEPFVSPEIGWAEQHPENWWQATTIAIRKSLAERNLHGEDISCVGFSGQMHGAVMLDGQGAVVRPALIWCDQRTEKQSQDLIDLFGRERIIQITSNPPLTNFTLTKLLWVRENEPANWQRIQHIMLPKDYVRYRLTGESATDVSDASGTLLLNVANRSWAQEILEKTQIPAGWLPSLFESCQICGKVSQEGAKSTGLKSGTPVVAGAGDQAAGAVGMGIVSPGAVSATIGTSGVVFAATDRPALDPAGRLHTFCHAIPNRWHVMGVTQAAGLSLQWLRDQILIIKDALPDKTGSYNQLMDEASAVPAGADGLLWAPYLMGERTPYLDPNVRGALLGLTASHTRGHVVRAVLEGVAFSLKDTFTILEEMHVPVSKVRLGGGGAKSSLWRQIQADIYGHEVEIVEAEEGAAFGAALLAGIGIGMWPSVDTACREVVRAANRVLPNPASKPVMNRNYAAYRRIYPAMKSIFSA